MIRYALPLVVLAAALASGCRDRVDRDKAQKATGLAGAPPPPPSSAAEPKCPAGAELMGAPRPRGAGMWCQAIADGRLRVFRIDGSLWAEGAVDSNGMRGEVKFYAPDGQVALVRQYANNSTQGDDDVKIEGVELPPTILSVCTQDVDKPPTTTRCPR